MVLIGDGYVHVFSLKRFTAHLFGKDEYFKNIEIMLSKILQKTLV